jgi:hypothetical protein
MPRSKSPWDGEHSEIPAFFRVSSHPKSTCFAAPTQRVNLEIIASHCFSAVFAVFAVFAVVNCFF